MSRCVLLATFAATVAAGGYRKQLESRSRRRFTSKRQRRSGLGRRGSERKRIFSNVEWANVGLSCFILARKREREIKRERVLPHVCMIQAHAFVFASDDLLLCVGLMPRHLRFLFPLTPRRLSSQGRLRILTSLPGEREPDPMHQPVADPILRRGCAVQDAPVVPAQQLPRLPPVRVGPSA